MNDRLPTVSIVTPTFNSAEFISEHLAGFAAQTYPNIEHVFVDGASTDTTLALINEYAKTRNVKVISRPDNGPGEAINGGLKVITGEIVMLMASDDLIFPWAVQVAVDYLLEHPDVDVVHGDWLSWDVVNDAWHLRLNPPFNRGFMGRTQPIAVLATYFRRRVLDEIGDLDNSYRHANDLEFMLRATQGRKVGSVREILSIFRKRPGAINLSEGSEDGIRREVADIQARHLNADSRVFKLLKIRDRIYSAIYRRLSLMRLLSASKRTDGKRSGASRKGRWDEFLSVFQVTLDSDRNFLSVLLPNRSSYGTRFRFRSDQTRQNLTWVKEPGTKSAHRPHPGI